MAYYDALIAKWATLTGTAEEKLAAINALTLVNDVEVSAVEGMLSLAGSLTAMEDWIAANPSPSATRTAIKELLRTISSPHTFTFVTSNPQVLAALTQSLSLMVAANLITQAQMDALLALSNSATPWVTAGVGQGGAGLSGPCTLDDLAAAGLS